MSYLLDTNVISETWKPKPDPAVLAWLAAAPDDELHLSVLVLGELRKGVESARRRDPRRAARLDGWLTEIHESYGRQTVAVTTEIADLWGRLNAVRPVPVIDGLMAATALVHDWTFVTRNGRDVGRTGVRLVDPFQP